MSFNLLKGKKGIIFGALNNQSIAWKIAEKCFEEGAQIVLTNAPVALRFGEINELAEKINAPVIPADVTSMTDLSNLFTKSLEHFGGPIDFVLHSVGMSMNVRKGNHYTNLDHELEHKTLDISAMSLHRVCQTAYQLDAMAEWGSIVSLSYIAAQQQEAELKDLKDLSVMQKK